jgi:hypothetical protein
MTSRLLLAAAACLLATACSSEADLSSTGATTAPSAAMPEGSSGATPAPSRVPSDGPVQEAAEPAFPADTTVDEQEATGGPLSVTAVRVARQDGYDRVVFELDGRQPGKPGWRVMYVDDPRRDGSGEPVDVEGGKTLVVLIEGVGYPFDTGVEEASGVSLPPDLEVVADVELGAVYEGVYETFIGVTREAPFRVFRLADPARVVVDVRHG